MSFDFTNEPLVFAATLFGEASGWPRDCLEDVAQCILNRHVDDWAPTVLAVCLAPWQFSCWNAGTADRARLLAAAEAGTDPVWLECEDVARTARDGGNPDRILGADSYYARSMSGKPSWACPPAVFRYGDSAHLFWQVRPVKGVPNVSVLSAADVLNQQQLDTMQET